MNITDELRQNRERLIRENRAQRLLTAHKSLMADLEFTGAYYYAYEYPTGDWTLSLNLGFGSEAEAREAALLLSQRLQYEHPVSKRTTTYADQVRTNFRISVPGLELTTNGEGAPRTCQVEYDEVEVPAHIERRARVVCPEVN